jgi:sulfate adenylyltransferase subunit 1 (EFTu-like GTPase family)
VAVNKMDLIGWDQGEYERISKEVHAFVDSLPHPVPVHSIPMSALLGDNVVDGSDHMSWYEGAPLLTFLEHFDATANDLPGARVHVQRVIRPQGGEFLDFRGYAGVVTAGDLTVGAPIRVLPSGRTSTVSALHRWGVSVEQAEPGHAIVVELADDVDVARGDVLVAGDAVQPPTVAEDIVADVCWMIDQPLVVGSRHWFKHGTRTGFAVVTSIEHRYDLVSLEHQPTDELVLNDIGRVGLRLSEPIVADVYRHHAEGGRLILIDAATNTTAGAGMIAAIAAWAPEI